MSEIRTLALACRDAAQVMFALDGDTKRRLLHDMADALEAQRETILAANGTSCRRQIADIVGREARHLVRILDDAAADGSDQFVAGPAIDRDGKAVPRQVPRDHRPQASRAAGYQSDTPARHCHAAIIPPRPWPT